MRPPEELHTAVERHRQEKMLRIELKRIAKSRARERERRRESAKRAKRVSEAVKKPPEQQAPVDAATKEIATRVLRRRRLIEFVKAFHPKYIAGWVHHDICKRLEKFSADVTAGRSPRLVLLLPPRHGKSKIGSSLFPAWHLGHNPNHEVIACSYNVTLATEFSREVRGTIRTKSYASLFPGTELDPEFQGVESWKLLSDHPVGAGGYVAAGVLGPITGKGAHVLVVDDPVKNAQEAESPEHLQKLWDWYISTAYTRLAPGGGVLIIQTPWSDGDISGRIQEMMQSDPDAETYEIVRYPAIATEDEEFRLKGDALFPERYPLTALERIKKQLGGDRGRYWNALYQQQPVPEEGAFFRKDMLVYRVERPNLDTCYLYQAWDLAIGEKRVNDWTVGVTIAVDHEDTAHVIDVVRFKSADQLRIADEILDAYVRFPRVQSIGIEDGQIWRGVRIHLAKRCTERRLYPSYEELKPLLDKTVRARPLQGRMLQHKVTLPREATWLSDVLRELLKFPHGLHDDIVDSLSWVMTVALGHAPPRKPAYEGGKMEESRLQKALKGVSTGQNVGFMGA